MHKTNSGLAQLYSIQILRALAASTVVYLHTFTAPSFGLFGVDLFFLISGFVMCLLIDNLKPRPGAFLLARIVRIVPLYWAVTTAVLLTALVAPSLMGTTVANFGNYVLSLLFIPHFREDGQMYPMLMPGWSLNYEMWYYVLITVVLTLNPRRYKWLIAMVLVATYVLSSGLETSKAPYDFLHSTLWLEFILGIVCYKIHRHPLLQKVPKTIALAITVCAYLVMAWLEVVHCTADRIFIAGIPSFMMLLFSLQLEGAIQRLRSRVLRFIVHVGDASYATYLSHMFVIGFIERIIFTRFHVEKSTGSALLTLAFCLAAGSILYHFIDRPGTRMVRSWQRRLVGSRAVARWRGSYP